MADRITTTCQHTHTVTLRLEEGEWPGYLEVVWDGPDEEFYAYTTDGWWPKVDGNRVPPRVHREIKAALAAAEALCGGCGCADRLRAEARDLAAVAQECIETGNERVAKIADAKSVGHFCAADFLDAAPDARGSDLSAEQPTTVSEQGHAKKRAEWNDPKEATDG